jgi:hypothetical protein
MTGTGPLVMAGAVPAVAAEGASMTMTLALRPASEAHADADTDAQHATLDLVSRAQAALLESVLPTIASLMRYHAERGDAQTCAVLARTLLPVAPILSPKARVLRHEIAYVERLQSLQLFGLANEVIKQSHDEGVHSLNQRSTSVHVGGGGASASRNLPPLAICSICQLPVRGMHAWCQGCGHGGHAHHMREWFQTSLECPTGCGHRCLRRTVRKAAALPPSDAVPSRFEALPLATVAALCMPCPD